MIVDQAEIISRLKAVVKQIPKAVVNEVNLINSSVVNSSILKPDKYLKD
jgi:hypothetical protein